MKTKRYFLEFENIDNIMLAKIELSQNEFKRQLCYLNNRVIETQNEEFENKIELRKRQYDRQTYVENVYYFTNCCCDTILSEYICKDGFVFRT